jgi:hypothetical protein
LSEEVDEGTPEACNNSESSLRALEDCRRIIFFFSRLSLLSVAVEVSVPSDDSESLLGDFGTGSVCVGSLAGASTVTDFLRRGDEFI